MQPRLIRVRDAIAEAWALLLGAERAREAADDVIAEMLAFDRGEYIQHARQDGRFTAGVVLRDAIDCFVLRHHIARLDRDAHLRRAAFESIAALYLDEALLFERCAPHAALQLETQKIERSIEWLRERVAEREASVDPDRKPDVAGPGDSDRADADLDADGADGVDDATGDTAGGHAAILRAPDRDSEVQS